MKFISKKLVVLVLFLSLLVACGSPTTDNINNNSNNLNSENIQPESNVNDNQPTTNQNTAVESEVQNSEPIEFSIPISDDALNIVDINESILSYSTKYKLDDFIEFFKTEMFAQGFSLGYEIVVADNAVVRFEQGDLAVILSTNSDGDGGFSISVGQEPIE